MKSAAIQIENVSHSYGEHQALSELTFAVHTGEIFGLLGPNGGGKTTLFKLLTTLLPVQTGSVTLAGCDVKTEPANVRRAIGITFQSPSLDYRLTVAENLKHQGHLYGMRGETLQTRITELVARLGLESRTKDRVESLSGGLKRRVEIAKGLLHDPQVLLLDEPSTGLDPAARRDVWSYLEQLRQQHGLTILVTTHIMEEAERCDRLGLLDEGKLIAQGTPSELRSSVGGDCLTIHSADLETLSQSIVERFSLTPQRVGEALRIEQENGHELLRDLVATFGEEITNVSLGKPTLEDVFIHRTGHQFWSHK